MSGINVAGVHNFYKFVLGRSNALPAFRATVKPNNYLLMKLFRTHPAWLPLVLLFSGVFGANAAAAQAAVTIRPAAVIKHNATGANGVNIVYPLDNDKYFPRKTPMVAALKNIGVGCLRFSEGHLADNYLWTVPPYEDAIKGLRPRVATMEDVPANWTWLTDKDGFFMNDLDFDDFVALCKKVGAEPIVTVNVQSYVYKGGPTKEFLINSVKEWVRYANVVRKYGVKYWQLGNEVEKFYVEKDTKPPVKSLREIMSKEDYCDIWGKMATAMKEVDPTIHVGTGVMSAPDWNQAVLEQFPGLVSFISCHQYTWGASFCSGGYPAWAAYQGVHIPNIEKMQKLLDGNPAWKNIEIVITETGSTGGSWPERLELQSGDKGEKGRYTNDLYKALNNWEMATAELATPAVKYLTIWCSRTPWRGPHPIVGIEAQFDADNNPTPTGKVTELINEYMYADMLEMPYVDGNLRLRASATTDKGFVSLFVLNKGDRTEKVDFSVDSPGRYTLVERVEFSGKSPIDQNPVITKKAVKSADKAQNAQVPPCSLTIFKFKKG